MRGLVAAAVLVAAFSGGAYVLLDGQGLDLGGAGGPEVGRTPAPSPTPAPTPRSTETRSPVWTPPEEPSPTPIPVTIEED
jgi:hypothetical protein